MGLREAILDALLETKGSIQKMERFLDFMRVDHSREAIVDTLCDLFVLGTVDIVYPQENDPSRLLVFDYDFEELYIRLTPKGRRELELMMVS